MKQDQPAYYAWFPALQAKGMVVSILLSRGSRTQAPEESREFFEGLLSSLKIDAPMVTWGVHPFVTRYFAGTAWEECWNAIATFKKKARILVPEAAGLPVVAKPKRDVAPPGEMPLRVLADFASTKAATECRNELRRRNQSGEWDVIHYAGSRIRDIGPKFKQLSVEVDSVQPARMEESASAAEEVMAICESYGGHTRVRTS